MSEVPLYKSPQTVHVLGLRPPLTQRWRKRVMHPGDRSTGTRQSPNYMWGRYATERFESMGRAFN